MCKMIHIPCAFAGAWRPSATENPVILTGRLVGTSGASVRLSLMMEIAAHMKNLVQTGLLVTVLGSLTACSVQSSNQEAVGTTEQDLTLTAAKESTLALRLPETKNPTGKRPGITPRGADLKLAALAHQVLACRGTISGRDFIASAEMITPRFVSLNIKTGFVTLPNRAVVQFTAPGKPLAIEGDIEKGAMLACPVAKDSEAALVALSTVVNLTGAQKFDKAIGAYWARSWSQAVVTKSCPAWYYVGVASGDPFNEKNLLSGSTKTTEYFKVDGDVETALTCAAGYGDSFIVGIEGNLIETDPAYWEDTRVFGSSNSPYVKAEVNGYMHNMKAYNDSFAAIQRVGEKCIDPILVGVLRENNCSDDAAYPWFCNSICL
jgi:hypothetical protein